MSLYPLSLSAFAMVEGWWNGLSVVVASVARAKGWLIEVLPDCWWRDMSARV